jgi:hypothetical protein
MQGTRLPNNTSPCTVGQYAIQVYADRKIHHPDEVGDGELWVCDPLGNFFRLVHPVHSWTEHEDNTISVMPSIVSPDKTFHGFLQKGIWS